MTNVLRLTPAQVINCAWKSEGSYWVLRPINMVDGGFAVSLECLVDPKYMEIWPILSQGTTVDITNWFTQYASQFEHHVRYYDGYEYKSRIDGKIVSVMSDKRYQRCIQSPADNRRIFDIRSGDQGEQNDPVFNRHRCELTSGTTLYALGADTWYSCSFKIYSAPSGVPMGILDIDGAYAITGQWHGNDAKTPPVSINFSLGRIGIWTTSSNALSDGSNGTLIQRYRAASKMTMDVYHTIVMRVKTGDQTTAIIQLWIDGVLVLSMGPSGFADGVCTGGIGYYALGAGFSSYFNYGVYCADKNHPDVLAWDVANPAGPSASNRVRDAITKIEYANEEWGTTSLLGRVTTPLPV